MPNKDRNIPKRRFKAFENADAWELRKLGEVVYRSNITSSSKVLPRLEFEDINSGLGTLNKDIFQKVNDDRKGLEFNEGDVLFGKLRPYLKNWWYAEFNGIALGDFWNLKSDVWHSCFLYTYIQSNAFQLVANDTSGTKMPRSDWNLVAESIAKFPSLPEQKAIGTFFSTLDQQITLHQRKLDKLKHVKQAYLSEMFPAEGERVPKRRFPGFTDDWELRKLGECFTERNETMLNGELLSVTINDGIKKFSELNRHDNSNQDKSKYKKVCVGDIAYNSMRMWQGASGYSKYEGIVSPAYTVLSPKENICSECLAYQFKLPFIKHKFQINSQGITSDNWVLKFPTLSEIEIFVSKDKEEQIKIATFFSTLDQQITLHQRKLEKLKNLKKALLNELFV
ncbi:TPA: restriction endonuclease subunit S [Streptococcus suis]